jgi:hypothetical protein
MKHLIVSAAVVALATSAASAQQAVQWRIEDGGNGHWYRVDSALRTWPNARDFASSIGGHLASVTSASEGDFVIALSVLAEASGPWLGGFQDPSASDYAEPAAGWRWVTGEAWSFVQWCPGEPNDSPNENCLALGGASSTCWNDLPSGGVLGVFPVASIIEWSADCNNDGIVDYGQCRDGSLPDYNLNNIPDCCEASTPCDVGNYPVQWRIADGGNGSWYQSTRPTSAVSWESARELARLQGGHLPVIRSEAENTFVLSLFTDQILGTEWGPFIGGVRDSSAENSVCEGWKWTTGEPFDFLPAFSTADAAAFGYGPCDTLCQCLNEQFVWETCLHYWRGECPVWNSAPTSLTSSVLLVEWSADCNNDGIVDYGQILSGQLADANINGVPDSCEADSCPADVTGNDLVDGVDLAAILGAWGTDGQNQYDCDINNDGVVSGTDLAFVLGGWGPCP